VAKKQDDILIERHYIDPGDPAAVEQVVESTAAAFKILAEIINKKKSKKELVS